MSGRFSTEQREFVAVIRDFCRRTSGSKELRDALTDNGREWHNPGLYTQLAQAGLLGVSIPEAYGCSGGGLAEQVLLIEELWHGICGPAFPPRSMPVRVKSNARSFRARSDCDDLITLAI
jgi:alkylation response protein AidB-like acyl-CoA dehydrogenase